MKKIIWIVVIVVIILILILISLSSNKNDDSFVIGAILPLSGPAAIWGENVQNGIELALSEYPNIRVLYEDSKGKPADGVSAFRVLKEKNVDLALSILSSVTVPISKVAQEEKFPLFGTLTAADGVANDYTTRYYSNSINFSESAFIDEKSPLGNIKNVTVLHRNDDLGISVMNQITNFSKEYQKEIVHSDSFTPGETDFSTIMLKIKNTNAEALMFVPVTPGEAVGIVTAANELGLDIPLIESSNVFADMETRNQVNGLTFYTNIYDFSVEGNNEEFKRAYREKYDKEPNFGAAFGYDSVKLIEICSSQKENISECLREIKDFKGVTGLSNQILPGDFNVPMILDKVN